tara:strand:- start:47 stop:268 length:222 start_codon:yes stop_codon:yes gene_type:complete
MKLVHEFENYHDYEGHTPDAKGGGGATVRITLDDNSDACPVTVLFNLPDGEELFELSSTMPRSTAEKILNLKK